MCGLFGSLGFEAINTEAVFEALQERGQMIVAVGEKTVNQKG